jgi:putative intracellular protease/amidase
MKLIQIAMALVILVASTRAATQKVLIVVTNHSTLGTTGKKTGYYLPEVSHPYYKLKSAGFKITFGSPEGGKAPMDPKSKDLKDPLNKRFFMNKKLMGKLDETVSLSDINAADFSAVVFTGGHGTMWDFPNSASLKKITVKIYENGGVVAAVCHGPAALVNIKLSNGKYLLYGKSVTGFTNEEEKIVKLTDQMPFLLESKMIERGANFKKGKAWEEKVVVDQRVVTGQNPASASKLGDEVVKLLRKSQ